MDTNKRIGGRIKVRRVACGLTQAELAGKLGVSQQQVAKIEYGRRIISAAELAEIARCLETPVAWFYNDTRPPPDVRRGTVKMITDLDAVPEKTRNALGRLISTLATEPGGTRHNKEKGT